jgi:hypothetical protein
MSLSGAAVSMIMKFSSGPPNLNEVLLIFNRNSFKILPQVYMVQTHETYQT